ncbi:superoxide dismutase family protein [Lacinutrix sp. MedPE-SW]|uniref:superoxide dismutase family protein n=1 Tax=Lacinutrix sp. MedPE-SW TaxID=1860087 RepID=UPI00091B9A9E|nr:superoxide dismutase family protein [Lacinutrix sp. MedPE-SW]OIQ22955.1 MAG: superoxide dismutase [Lacinutrix sp. MedPE-SW]
MKKLVLLTLLAVSVCTISCKKDAKDKVEPITEAEKAVKVKFALSPKSDSNVKGNVVFTQEKGKVEMTAILEGLEPGEHAIHIHEKADCSSSDGKSTGGHWNPTGKPHGKWGDAAGYHKGDIGNFSADEKGFAAVNFSTDEWCIGCEDKTKDILGKAIIVHQGTDDFTSQPSGAAGSRISCGGIIQ